MRATVVVPTYNAPDALDLVLTGLRRQSRRPDEIVIADDGSTEETAALVARWQERLDVQHVRHEDRGFRKSRIVNEAVARSSGDHLLFVDGDTIPHRHWVADHLAAAKGRRVLCGRRVRLGPELTKRVDAAMIERGDLERCVGPLLKSRLAGDTRRYRLGIRLPAWLARLLHPRWRKLMGVNFSLPRAVFTEVNGYDEDWEEFGAEDRDLGIRLRRGGYELFPLLNRAVVYHLWHEESRPSEEILRLRAQKDAEETVRCEAGLDRH